MIFRFSWAGSKLSYSVLSAFLASLEIAGLYINRWYGVLVVSYTFFTLAPFLVLCISFMVDWK